MAESMMDMCDHVASACGYQVMKTATRRDMNIPSRRYVNAAHRQAFWFEIVSRNRRLSRDRYTFLRTELGWGSLATAGGTEELIELLRAIPDTSVDPHAIATAQLEVWRFHGLVEFRSFKKPRRAA